MTQPMPAASAEPKGSAAVAAASRTSATPLSAASTQSPLHRAVMVCEPLSMIPALAFFSLFERRIVGGLTGAVAHVAYHLGAIRQLIKGVQ